MSRCLRYPHIEAYLVGLKKKIGLDRQLPEIDTLILGSSHGQYSYIPQKNEYNLCLPSQDLYYAYSLYKKYCKKAKNLKTVVLFYSVFSPGYEVLKTKEDFRSFHYNLIFGIKPHPRRYWDILSEKYGSYLPYMTQRAEKLRVSKSYHGENPDIKGKNVNRIGQTDPNVRAQGALKHNQRNCLQNKYMEKMILLAKKCHHNFVLVLSPAHQEYKNVLPAEKELFSGVFRLVAEYPSDMMFLDFYKRNDFEDTDWWDYDHLNPLGAEKFTRLYHDYLYRLFRYSNNCLKPL